MKYQSHFPGVLYHRYYVNKVYSDREHNQCWIFNGNIRFKGSQSKNVVKMPVWFVCCRCVDARLEKTLFGQISFKMSLLFSTKIDVRKVILTHFKIQPPFWSKVVGFIFETPGCGLHLVAKSGFEVRASTSQWVFRHKNYVNRTRGWGQARRQWWGGGAWGAAAI